MNLDIITSVLEYDPVYSHRLISKIWNIAIEKINIHMKVWNYNINDYKVLNYINKNILKIEEWGDEIDISYYSSKLNKKNQINNTLESLCISPCTYSDFINLYEKEKPIDIQRIITIAYWVGAYSNLRLIHFLRENEPKVFVDTNILEGAIHYESERVLEHYLDYYKEDIDNNLDIYTTICAHGNDDIWNLICDLGLKVHYIPYQIRLTISNISTLSFIKGLIKLNVTPNRLNFNRINKVDRCIFISYRRTIINKLLRYKFYNDKVLEIIIDTSLRYGYIDILDKLLFMRPDIFPLDIINFIVKYHSYLCLEGIKWINKHYIINSHILQFIKNNKTYRTLSVALWCMRRIY